VIPANLVNRANRVKAAATTANPVKVARVEMAVQPTTVGEPSLPVVLSQAIEILKRFATAPKAVATAKVEAAGVVHDRSAPQEMLVHLGKSVLPAEPPMPKAV
jgi:hypothetical protein